nr:MAG TPA: hypothetical protein [Caudoviricetes sp.]
MKFSKLSCSSLNSDSNTKAYCFPKRLYNFY